MISGERHVCWSAAAPQVLGSFARQRRAVIVSQHYTLLRPGRSKYIAARLREGVALSWCDKLASTPSVGLRIDNRFVSSSSILNALAPILDRWVDGDNLKFTIERQEPFSLVFTTDDGFQYGIEQSRIYVSFTHRVKAKASSGGPPVMEMLSQPLPYTELLPQASEKLIEAALIVPDVKGRKVTRIGIIASTTVAREDLPPGIARFIEYLGRPWKGLVPGLISQIVADINKAPAWTDRCIHTINKPEDPDELVTLSFDWQRTLAQGRAITSDNLKELTSTSQRSALQYFEDLAEGNRFDEELISSAT